MAVDSRYLNGGRFDARTPPAFPFLSLPPEIRNTIYRMLLTASYKYVEGDRIPYFERSPPIWLVNKQLAVEATRTLYEENEFVTVAMNTGLRAFHNLNFHLFSQVPVFNRLRPAQVAKPVLKVRIDMHEESRGGAETQITFITSLQGIQHVIQALWGLLMCSDKAVADNKRYISLNLEFQNKVPSRQKYFIRDILKPWTQLHNIGEVSLKGNISNDILLSVSNCLMSDPQPIDVTRWMEVHQHKITGCLIRKDYPAARSSWRHMRLHWFYYHHLDRKSTSRSEPLKDALYSCVPSIVEGSLEVAKSYIHRQLYGGAGQVIGWILDLIACKHFKSRGQELNPILEAKYHLCCSLTRIVWRSASVFDSLNKAVTGFLKSIHYKDKDPGAMLDEFYRSIGDYLSTLNSPELEGIVFLERETEKYSTAIERRTFWEWLDVPEE